MRKSFLFFLVMILVVFVWGSLASAAETLMMATTTSTDNTGILAVIGPAFQKESGAELRWTAVGSGKALELGKNCDVDVLLVHAPEAEKKFVEEGLGIDRTQVMFNDYVLLGPANDPAGITGKSTAEALKALSDKKATFVSRGDDSGTHKAELALWKKAGLPTPDKDAWYVQAGQGMLATITVAAERNGYTLTDRGTYYTYASKAKEPALKIIIEGDKALLNQYSVIAVNPQRCPKAKYELAKRFGAWMASPVGQQLIQDFKTDGKALFTPNAGK